MIKKLNIAVASGKGGTGKTLVSTNLAYIFESMKEKTTYLDCDVEAPDGHLFLKPEIYGDEEILVSTPAEVDEKCTLCGRCEEVCRSNAVIKMGEKILFFPELCNSCGACSLVCPTGAIVEKKRSVGKLKWGKSSQINCRWGLINTGEGAITVRVINKVKSVPREGVTLLDSPPGAACPTAEAIKDADITLLVTDPTPFGMHDFKLTVDLCSLMGIKPLVIANRLYPGAKELEEYCSKHNLKIIGRIPDEREIARIYSEGKLIASETEKYNKLFTDIAQNIIEEAPKVVRQMPQSFSVQELKGEKEKPVSHAVHSAPSARQILVISGKGGTGKTSIAAAFSFYSRGEAAIADCDVDAADLHFILKPDIKDSGYFIGGEKMEIETGKCTGCGRCEEICKFDAVSHESDGKYKINELACEGCGACLEVCPFQAISSKEVRSGIWFNSSTRFGPMAHAKLSPAGENSGKLVTLIKKKAGELAADDNALRIIYDGSPGIGCPVIASLTGVDYVLIVTEPTVAGIHDLERVLDLVKHFKLKAGVVVNKSDLNPTQISGIFKLTEKYGQDILGEIPYDRNITEAQIEGLTLPEYAPKSPAAKKMAELWDKIK